MFASAVSVDPYSVLFSAALVSFGEEEEQPKERAMRAESKAIRSGLPDLPMVVWCSPEGCAASASGK